MAGTKAGGLKAAQKNKANNPNFYKEIGKKGGQSGHTGGFYNDPVRAKACGAKGGKSHRGRGPAKRDANGRPLKKDGTPYKEWPKGRERARKPRVLSKEEDKRLEKAIAEIEKETKTTLTYEEMKTQRRNLFLRIFRRKK